MGHHLGVIVSVALAMLGCARAPDPLPFPTPPVVPRLSDSFVGYRQLGMFASQGDVRFVGRAAAFRAAHPDSAILVLGLSLPNAALTFRQHPDFFEAEYEVLFTVGQQDAPVAHGEAVEMARVGTFEETRRQEESLLFQQTLPIPRGEWPIRVEVRDRYGNRADSAAARLPARLVPDLNPVLVHEVVPRSSVSEIPRLLINPSQTVWYPVDTIRVYLEARLPRSRWLPFRLGGPGGERLWEDSVHVEAGSELAAAVVRIPAEVAPLGVSWLETGGVEGEATARVPVVVSAPGLPGVLSMREVRSLLRYFDPARTARLDATEPAERIAAWHEIWRETDPEADTPGNEALESYFARVLTAAARFEEIGRPGWLTDRGMVYLSLGPADRVEPARAMPGGGRAIRWRYRTGSLTTVTMTFEDPTSLGRYRLTEESRRAFARLRMTRESGS